MQTLIFSFPDHLAPLAGPGILDGVGQLGLEPGVVDLPGLVVEEDAEDDGDGAQAGEEGHGVAEQHHGEPDEQSALGCVSHAEKERKRFYVSREPQMRSLSFTR